MLYAAPRNSAVWTGKAHEIARPKKTAGNRVAVQLRDFVAVFGVRRKKRVNAFVVPRGFAPFKKFRQRDAVTKRFCFALVAHVINDKPPAVETVGELPERVFFAAGERDRKIFNRHDVDIEQAGEDFHRSRFASAFFTEQE